MNLSSYKEHAEVACQEAKEEIKGRKMLSASYRFKHQDSEELERLAKEQQEIFEQVWDSGVFLVFFVHKYCLVKSLVKMFVLYLM